MTISIGTAQITRVTELEQWPFPPRDLFPAFQTDMLLRAGASLGELPVDPRTGDLVLSIQNYVIRTPSRTILVDTCNGNAKQRPNMPPHHDFNTGYLDRLTEGGITVDDVDTVINTHLHPDHCGWNTTLVNGQWVPTFPNARYLFVRTELEAVTALADNPTRGPVEEDFLLMLADSIDPVFAAQQAEQIEPGHVIADTDGLRIEVRAAPGHTPGHCVIEIIGDDTGALITGDVIHHPLQLAVPTLTQAGDNDPETATNTRIQLLDECADRNLVLLPAHFTPPDGGRIARRDDGYAFIATP